MSGLFCPEVLRAWVDLQKKRGKINQTSSTAAFPFYNLAKQDASMLGLLSPPLHRLKDHSAGARLAEELGEYAGAQMGAELFAKLILLYEFRQVQALGRAGNSNKT